MKDIATQFFIRHQAPTIVARAVGVMLAADATATCEPVKAAKIAVRGDRVVVVADHIVKVGANK